MFGYEVKKERDIYIYTIQERMCVLVRGKKREREGENIHTYASNRDAYIYTRDTRLRFEYFTAVYIERERERERERRLSRNREKYRENEKSGE